MSRKGQKFPLLVPYRVESGIPMPRAKDSSARRKPREGLALYPWYNMEVGDSFFVHDRSANSICASARQIELRTGYQFACRKSKKDGTNGYRVWRMK